MTRLEIKGMNCQHCVKAVNGALAGVRGVDKVVDVSLERGAAEVDGNADTATSIAAVEKEGYEASAA